MNRFTLVFTNKALEESYQQYYYNQFRNQIYKLAHQYFFALAGLMIAAIENMDHYITIFGASVAIAHSIILYNWGLIKTDYIYYYYNTLISTGPELILCLIYSTRDNKIITINLILILLAFPTVFIKSNNVIMATLQILHYYIMAVVCLIYFIDSSLYILSWFPMCILWIYSYYIQVKNDRELFQKSQINQSIYELMKQTTREEFIIFDFNQDKSQYETECTNISELNLPQYLMGFYILENKFSLSFYIFNRYIKQNQDQDTSEIITGYQKEYSQSIKQLELYVQTYPKLKFSLKIPLKRALIQQALFKEHNLINIFLKYIFKSLLRTPNNQFQSLLNHFKLQIGIRRLHCVLQKYQLTKSRIVIRDILDTIAKDLKIKVWIIGDATIHTDLGLLIQVLQIIYVMIQTQNREVHIQIEQQGEDAFLNFQFDKSIKYIMKNESSTIMVYFNQIYSILSNGFIKFDKLQIAVEIIGNPYIPFK